ncbi:MAG: transposase [Bacteroidota bacterium]
MGGSIGFKLLTVCLVEVNINADVFYQWLVQDLLLKVPERSVIVLDNAIFHKRNDIRKAIEERQLILEFLPPYSPDLNPIEQKWAQAKAIRRKLRCNPYQLFLHPEL